MLLFKRIVILLSITILVSKDVLSAEGMPQFNANTFPSQLFWLVITFFLLYLFMNFLVLPRIRANIRLRKNKISNDIERAELTKLQIDKIIKEYDEKIRKSKYRANETIKSSIEKADQDFTTQLQNVKKRIAQRIHESEKETVEYKNKISKEINSITLEVTALLVKKILGQSLSKNDIEYINNQLSITKVANEY